MRDGVAGRGRERALERSGFARVAGVDEVGRGCLAGPVVAAAVILDRRRPVAGLRDSKLLSRRRREALAAEIRARAVAVGVGEADAREIESMNILRATLLAMGRAVGALSTPPDYVLVDALRIPGLDVPQEGLVRGDRRIACIAAASIVAKVHRDALMCGWHERLPGYRFDLHKGYGTPVHLAALRRLGVSPLHRATFRRVRFEAQPTLFGDPRRAS